MKPFILESGKNKGNRRIWIEGSRLIDGGWRRGQKFSRTMNPDGSMTLSKPGTGHSVAGKSERPIIDFNGKWVTHFMGRHKYFEVSGDVNTLQIWPTHDESTTQSRAHKPNAVSRTVPKSVPKRPNREELDRIDGLLASFAASIEDVRRPGDALRKVTFRTGWKHSASQDRANYSSQSLKKLTWQNLGYRLGMELGGKPDEWVDAAYEHALRAFDSTYFSPTTDPDKLDEKVAELREYAELGDPPAGNRTPRRCRASEREVVERDPNVKRWILDSADGVCELCRMQAPYRSKAKGNPWYLEVHHVVGLKDGGPDTTCNTVALCPNCHTKCHHSMDHDVATQTLYDQVERLVGPHVSP